MYIEKTTMLYNEIRYLIAKDIQLELRQKYALNGIVLYVVSSVFITYLSFGDIINSTTWNALFWIIFLFSAINAISKSFIQENLARQLYYYTLASPVGVILSKIIYNIILTVLLALLNYAIYSIWMGDNAINHGLFICNLLLGATGIASVLTMVAAIAWRSHNNFTLMAILSFPLVLPLLLSLIRVSAKAVVGDGFATSVNILFMIILLNFIAIALAVLLFPYLWKD